MRRNETQPVKALRDVANALREILASRLEARHWAKGSDGGR